jgi:uncharacterized protein YdhG (YjbR/CyaY superfamily)
MLESTNIDEYIARYDEPVQRLLNQMRSLIHEAAPEATEVISYGMPAFKQLKVLVYFAAARNHIGFYPTGSGVAAFAEELTKSGYRFSKGAIQFPMKKPLPEELIQRIVRFRIQDDLLRSRK